MATFPYFWEEHLRLVSFRKGELPLFIRHYHNAIGYPNHHHEYVEISLITRGHGTEIINGVKHPLQPGSICLLLPYQLHALEFDENQTDGLHKISVMFDMQLLFQTDFAEVGRWIVQLSDNMTPFYELAPAAYEAIAAVLTVLNNEYNADPEPMGKQGFMRLQLLVAIYLYFRHHPGFASMEQLSPAQPTEWDYVKYVHTHFLEEQLSLENAAQHFGVNVNVFRHAFKRLVGKNFLEYLHQLRVRRATGLLSTTNMSVVEIAYEVGFSSLRSFIRVFKETTGLSATDYRKQHTRVDE